MPLVRKESDLGAVPRNQDLIEKSEPFSDNRNF